jgi:8-oxo-dGTP diphosphatase
MSPDELKKIHVVAGLICEKDRVLVCQRSASGPFPLKWEFPGGKVEPAEEPYAALCRELKEELDISVSAADQMCSYNHVYPGILEVELRFYDVKAFAGEIANLAFEKIMWAKFGELSNLDFLEGDLAFVAKLEKGLIYPR